MCVFAVLAQASLYSQDDKKSMINKVKKSDKYIYAEATLPSLDAAYALSEELLYNNINEWILENKKMNNASNIILRNTSDEWVKIDLPRGNMYRAFVYVAKSDIIPADNVVILEKTEVDMDETVDISLDNVPDEIIPVNEVETVADPLSDELQKELLSLKTLDDVGTCLVKLKREGKIVDYNKYAVVKNEVENYYMIVYNQEGKIEAVLGMGKEERINLRTKKMDSQANYKGCGAICFKVK